MLVDPQTTSLKLRFQIQGSSCQIGFRWLDQGDGFRPFGDPVPVFSSGPRAGFHVHDIYHLTLLAETGWSEVLDILLAGARGGVFGGVHALAEEAVVLQHHLVGSVDANWAVQMLAGMVTDAEALGRAFTWGDALRYRALRQLERGRKATVRIDGIPSAFAARTNSDQRRAGSPPVFEIRAVRP